MKHRTALTVIPGIIAVALALASAAPPAKPPQGEAKPAPAAQPPHRDSLRAYVDALRADLSNGKVKTINDVMKLSDEEAKVFWPIYKDYEDELFENGDRRVALIKEYTTLTASHALTDDKARELAPRWFEFQTQQLELLKKYYGILQDKLSPIRAAQFVQIEHRFALVVDLTIASELPLIETAAR
jgi:hypothetical protein